MNMIKGQGIKRKVVKRGAAFFLFLIMIFTFAGIIQLDVEAEVSEIEREKMVLDAIADNWIESCTYVCTGNTLALTENVAGQFSSDMCGHLNAEVYQTAVINLGKDTISDIINNPDDAEAFQNAWTKSLVEDGVDTATSLAAKNYIKDEVSSPTKKIMRFIKKNLAIAISLYYGDRAIAEFKEAKDTENIVDKRKLMATATYDANVCCRLTADDVDKMIKNPPLTEEDAKNMVFDSAISFIGTFHPEVQIAYDVITLTIDFGIKFGSIQSKLDTLQNYIDAPPLGDELDDKTRNDFLNALMNPYSEFTYSFEDDYEVCINKYVGYFKRMSDYETVIIPSTLFGVDELPEVKIIGSYFLSGNDDVTEVTIPSTIESLSSYCINNCKELKKINYNAIDACGGSNWYRIIDCESLTTIEFDENIISIPQKFINNCGIKELDFPRNVEYIGNHCVSHCASLSKVTIPASVEVIECNAINDCDGLELVNYYAKNASMGNTGGSIMWGCNSKFRIDFGNTNDIIKIPNLMYDCGIQYLILPEGVEEIGNVSNCPNLKTITIPSTAKKFSFEECTALKTLNYNAISADSGTIVQSGADDNMTINWGDNINKIPEGFLRGCKIDTIVFPDTVQEIGSNCIGYCNNLNSVKIPASVKSIGHEAINNCKKLNTVYYYAVNATNPDEDKDYYGSIISECGAESDSKLSIVFGDNILKLPSKFIEKSNISEIVFKEGLQEIGKDAISGCESLTSVTIPSSLKRFNGLIGGCNNLQSVNYNAINAEGRGVVGSCACDFTINIGDEVERIPSYFVVGCNISSLIIPESVIQIDGDCISDCDYLTTITFPSSLRYFGECVLYRCKNLQNIYYNAISAEGSRFVLDCNSDFTMHIGDNVVKIPTQFIEDCNISTLFITEGVEEIASNCIMNCNNLETISIPSTVDKIGSGAITNCANLSQINYSATSADSIDVNEYKPSVIYNCGTNLIINISDNVISMPSYFLQNCRISNIEFPLGVKKIGSYFARNCDDLRTVTIPSTLTEYGGAVISFCDNLETIYYNAHSATMIEDNMAYGLINECGSNFEVVFGDDVKRIPDYFIKESGIEYIEFPEGVIEIGDCCISYCNNLSEVTIPSTVKTFKGIAIISCDNLNVVNYNAIEAETPSLGGVIYGCASDFVINFGGGITKLPGGFVSDCGITRVDFPEGLIELGDLSISNCAYLKYVTIPISVRKANGNIIFDCDSLNTIYYNPIALLNGDETIGQLPVELIVYCDSDFSIELGDKVSSIPKRFIERCGITSIVLPENINMIEDGAFDCDSLQTLTVLNRDCNIEWQYYTISDNTLVRGYVDTPLYEYAINYNKKFEDIGCNHNFATETVEATTEHDGYTRTYCTVCGYIQSEEVYPALVPNPIHVDGITVNPTTQSIKVGNSFTIVPTLTPNNATNKNVLWSSSNESVARVDNTGKVIGVSAGNAVITCATADGDYKAICTVTVQENSSFGGNSSGGGSSGGSSSGGSSGGGGGSSSGGSSGGGGGSSSGGSGGGSSSDKPVDPTPAPTPDPTPAPTPAPTPGKQDASEYTNSTTGEVILDKIAVPETDEVGTKITKKADGSVVVSDAQLGSSGNVSPAVFAEGQVYRLYNPNTGEHFYTKNPQERDSLASVGWNYEADQTSKTIASTEEGAKPVYRVYNPNSGLHHYTTNKDEAVMLKGIGWNYEGISMYAYDNNSNKGTVTYRVYCPFPDANGQNQHIYTTSAAEVAHLVSLGYQDEGTAWRVK